MSTNAISNSTSSPWAGAAATAVPTKTLNQQDFLKLLVAQMTAQDPLNPQTNTDFAAQMAQFTALETSQATQADVTQIHADQQLLQATSLIGRSVTLQSGSGAAVTGTVSAVQVNSGVPQLVVNGSAYDLSQVVSIAPSATNP